MRRTFLGVRQNHFKFDHAGSAVGSKR